jgi:hypothetical protein
VSNAAPPPRRAVDPSRSLGVRARSERADPSRRRDRVRRARRCGSSPKLGSFFTTFATVRCRRCAYARRVIRSSVWPSNSCMTSASAPRFKSREPYERRRSWNTAGGLIFAALQARFIHLETCMRFHSSPLSRTKTSASPALPAVTPSKNSMPSPDSGTVRAFPALECGHMYLAVCGIRDSQREQFTQAEPGAKRSACEVTKIRGHGVRQSLRLCDR